MKRFAMLTHLIRFLKDGSGDNLIGYALIAALVSITIVGSVEAMGSTTSDSFFAASGAVVTDAGGE